MAGQGRVFDLSEAEVNLPDNIEIYSSANYVEYLNGAIDDQVLFGPEVSFAAAGKYYEEHKFERKI